MTRPRLAVSVWIAACVGLLGACAGLDLEKRARGARTRIKQARDAGAYTCAPRELATAEANVEFAESELHQGDYFRARDHVEAAELSAAQALQRSSGSKCKGQPEPKPEPDAQVKDSDGDGIMDPEDQCIVEREDADGFEDKDGCPDPDNDADGLPDTTDKCVDKAEDLDGFEDADGCPDDDNDKDGVVDGRDGCPLEPEDADGFEDEDGCPDRDNDKDTLDDAADKCPNEAGPVSSNGCPEEFKLIEVKQDRIELKQKVFFPSSKAKIGAVSFPMLEEISQALKARPTMHIRIEGHTDSRGSRKFNTQLSQARADAVRAHLLGLGVPGSNMESVGFGPAQPIETNRTAAGREKNRRVEFVITSQ